MPRQARGKSKKRGANRTVPLAPAINKVGDRIKTIDKIMLPLASVWYLAVGFISPHWLGFAILCILGCPKGYGYSVEYELGFYIFLGILMLIIWLICFMPAAIYLHYILKKRTSHAKLILLAAFIAMSLFTVRGFVHDYVGDIILVIKSWLN